MCIRDSAQLESKPSILTAIKDNIIRYVYNPKTLSTDLFDVEKINNEINPKIFEVKKQPDLFNEVKEEIAKKRNEIIEEKVEPVIVQPVLQKNSQKEERCV